MRRPSPAFAQAPPKNVPAPAVNPNVVTAPGGKIIGADPDRNIRFEILRDISKPYK
jgi:hypothetical protein